MNYGEDTQKILLSLLSSSEELFIRVRSIIKPYYFDKKFQKTVKFIITYADEHNALPDERIISSETGLEVETFPDIDRGTGEWFLKEIENFCKYKALEYAVESGPEMIDKGDYAKLEKRIKDAILISLNKELGVNMFDNPASVIQRLKDNNGQVGTGWKTMDTIIYGGFNRGELEIFAGAPGTGKSIFLQNLAINMIEQGLNVVYFTYELSEELVAQRLMAMMAGVSTKDVMRKTDDVSLTIMQQKRKNSYGELHVKYMGAGSCTNDLKSYLKEYEIQTGNKIDVIVPDYLDLMSPNNKRVSPSDLFIKDKYVSEELRSLAAELNAICITASQLNRAAMEEQDHEMYHIAGGVSKINTADNVMTIYTSESLKERGEYRVQFIKTRSSAGVGKRLNLAFSTNSLRLSDLDEDTATQTRQTITDIGTTLNRKTTIKAVDAVQDDIDENDQTEKAKQQISDKGKNLRSIISNIRNDG